MRPSVISLDRSLAKYRVRRVLRRLLGDRDRAVAVGVAVLREHGLADAVAAYLAERLWDRGQPERAERLWQRLWKKSPGTTQWALDVARAARWRADYAEAERVLLAARESGAGGENLDTMIDYYQRSLRHSNSAAREALAMVDAEATPAHRLYWASVYLSAEGEFDAARRGLTRLLVNRRMAGQARVQLAALDAIERNGTSERVPGWFSPQRRSALVTSESSLLVVVFLSPTGWIGMPANAFHAILGRTPPNVLYLADSSDLYHLRGSDHFGPGYSAMTGGIRALARELGAKSIVTIGASTTGYTAIRVAIDVAAQGVIAFSPVTSLDPRHMVADGRLPALREKLLSRLPDVVRDTRPDLAALGGRLRVDIFYAADHVEDSWHAEHVQGLPGVRLHKLERSTTHDALGELLLRGEGDAVARLLDDYVPAESAAAPEPVR